MRAQAIQIQRAMLIVEDPTGETDYSFTADILADLGTEKTAKAMGWIVRQRIDATAIKSRLELDGERATTLGPADHLGTARIPGVASGSRQGVSLSE